MRRHRRHLSIMNSTHSPIPSDERPTKVQPELVLLDVGLPGIDGFQVALAIRARCPLARVVLTSSRDLADLGEDRVSACGAAGFVHKAELSRAALVAATATA